MLLLPPFDVYSYVACTNKNIGGLIAFDFCIFFFFSFFSFSILAFHWSALAVFRFFMISHLSSYTHRLLHDIFHYS